MGLFGWFQKPAEASVGGLDEKRDIHTIAVADGVEKKRDVEDTIVVAYGEIADFERFVHAAGRGCVNEVRGMMKSGIDVDGKVAGYSAMLAAAQKGRTAVTRLLLDAGANAEAAHDENGCTPLYMAAGWGNADVAELLLAHDENG